MTLEAIVGLILKTPLRLLSGDLLENQFTPSMRAPMAAYTWHRFLATVSGLQRPRHRDAGTPADILGLKFKRDIDK